MTDFANELNSEQLGAVQSGEGQALVVAGAGSGKTRVLTYRVAYLLEKMGVLPYEILAITFTNKAAKEMKERLERMVEYSDGLWVSTFHSFCAKVLRLDGDKLGYTSAYSIYADSDSDRLVKRIMDEKGIDDNLKGYIRNHISSAKNQGLNYVEYENQNPHVRDIDAVCSVYKTYDERLKQSNAMDFDDLLLKTCQLFVTCPDVLAKYQRRFRHVLIDEFQDTNRIQYLLVRLLGQHHGNIFAVGDDDQSIYSWRGALPKNMLDFKKDYPACKLYKLEKNYRSTPEILEIANKIIRNNRERIGHELYANKQNGVKVEVQKLLGDRAEAEFVADTIHNLMRYNGYTYSDFAVLVRVNSITRLFEERFNLYNMPYRVFGGFKFYERKEIRDVIAYLRILVNPRDDESILRIINFPKRGIGDGAIAKILETASTENVSVFEVIMGAEDNPRFATALKVKLSLFKDLLSRLMSMAQELGPEEFLERAVLEIGLKRAYETDNEEDANRWLNVAEFVASGAEFFKNNAGADLPAFLESISLLSDTDEMQTDDCITVATVHAVKGLEFRAVFVVGLEENIFPISRAVTSNHELEEERRVMYVAVTRAKERLYLTCASSRYRFNHVESNLPSRFLRETGLLGMDDGQGNAGAVRRQVNTAQVNKYALGTTFGTRPQTVGSGPVQRVGDKDISRFTIGMRVVHKKFGEGTIVGLRGEGRDRSASIAFPGLGIKQFALLIAPVEPLEE